METANWQAAPDLYKWIILQLNKVSTYKEQEDYENAYKCLTEIFFTIKKPIKNNNLITYIKMIWAKGQIDKAKDAMYGFVLESSMGDKNKINEIGSEKRSMEHYVDLFHELLFEGAYDANLLIPTKETDRNSGAKKFMEKYIKGEKDDDVDAEEGS